jgi:hypothetical protein
VAAVSGRKTLVWAVLLLALAGFYYVYEIQGGKQRRETARQQELLVHFSADDVTGLTVKRASETITAVRRNGHWHLTAPLLVPGDDQKYRELVRSLAELRRLRLVEEQPNTLEPFGLTSPPLELHITLKEQATPMVVRVGEKNPTGSGYYTQIEGRSAVYLINTTAKDALDASLYDVRDKTVLVFDAAEVQAVQLEPAAGTAVALQRQEADQWQLTAPVTATADTRQVQELLRSLRELKVQAFIDEHPADLEPYGLQTPALRLALTVGADRTVKTLLLGKVDTDRQGVYAKRSDTENVLLLSQQFWEKLPRTATALRDKTLLHYEREHITRLEMHTPDSQLVVTRTGPRQYRLEQPVNTDGDGDAIYSLLWDLKELKAKDFAAEAPTELAAYGLAPPRLRVTLHEEPPDKPQEARQHTLLFGIEAPDQQGTYVRVADRPTVYLVDSGGAQRLMGKSAFDLRNKKILAFEIGAVQKLQLQYPTAAFMLERRDKTWRLGEPHKQAVQQQWKVENLLYELNTLEYARLIAETTEDGAQYGLETPQVQITLWPKDGAPIGPLTIGKAVDSDSAETRLVYAQVRPGPSLYAIKADFLEALPKTLADFTSDEK